MLLIRFPFINVESGAQRKDAACPSPRVIICRVSKFSLAHGWHPFLLSSHEPAHACLCTQSTQNCLLHVGLSSSSTTIGRWHKWGLRKVIWRTLRSQESKVNQGKTGNKINSAPYVGTVKKIRPCTFSSATAGKTQPSMDMQRTGINEEAKITYN